jgi:glutathione S-transferase
LGQLPYLTVDGNKLPQSISMARFVARRHNLAGSDDLAQAQSDAVVDTVADLQNAYYQKVFMVKTEEASQKFFAEDALNHLGKLEKIITLYGSEGFSVGSSLTWADLHLWDVTSILVGTQANILDAFPRVKAVRKSVEANEGVAKWLKARPETQF